MMVDLLSLARDASDAVAGKPASDQMLRAILNTVEPEIRKKERERCAAHAEAYVFATHAGLPPLSMHDTAAAISRDIRSDGKDAGNFTLYHPRESDDILGETADEDATIDQEIAPAMMITAGAQVVSEMTLRLGKPLGLEDSFDLAADVYRAMVQSRGHALHPGTAQEIVEKRALPLNAFRLFFPGPHAMLAEKSGGYTLQSAVERRAQTLQSLLDHKASALLPPITPAEWGWIVLLLGVIVISACLSVMAGYGIVKMIGVLSTGLFGWP